MNGNVSYTVFMNALTSLHIYNNNMSKASPLWGASDMELIHKAFHTQENKKKYNKLSISSHLGTYRNPVQYRMTRVVRIKPYLPQRRITSFIIRTGSFCNYRALTGHHAMSFKIPDARSEIQATRLYRKSTAHPPVQCEHCAT